MPTISEYVLVSQSEPRIEHFLRDVNGAWVYRSAGSGDRLVLASGAVMDIDAIFARVLEIAGD